MAISFASAASATARRWRAWVGAALLATAAGPGPSHGAVPAPQAQAPSPELTTAHRWLERLAAAARIDQPLTLVVRTGAPAPCPSSMTDPVNSGNRSLEQATASVRGESLPSGPSLLCLRSRSLSSPMGGGFFIPFVVALQQQSDPFAADPPAALAIAGRTLLLHVPRGAAAGGSEPDASACLLARELMALQLGQPGQRSQAFERIHNGLAATIAASAKAGHNAQSTQEFGLFLFSPLQMLLSKATSPKHANPLSAELQESPYWVVLNRQANAVAEAIDSFADLPEEALKKAWRSWDGDFAMAAQDRLEVVEQQQRAAQDGALKLLAEAGIDPRPCAALAQPPVDQARLSEAIATFERTRTNPLITQRALPRRFLPETNSVVIFPASARPTATPR